MIVIVAVNTSAGVCVVPLKAVRTAAAGADAAAGGVFAAQTGGQAVQRYKMKHSHSHNQTSKNTPLHIIRSFIHSSQKH